MKPVPENLGPALLAVTASRGAGLLMAMAGLALAAGFGAVLYVAAPGGRLPVPLLAAGLLFAAFSGYLIWTGMQAYLRPAVYFEVFPAGIVPHYGDKGEPGIRAGPQGERRGRAVLIPWSAVEAFEFRRQFHIYRAPFRTSKRLIPLIAVKLKQPAIPPPSATLMLGAAEGPRPEWLLPAGGAPDGQQIASTLSGFLRQYRP